MHPPAATPRVPRGRLLLLAGGGLGLLAGLNAALLRLGLAAPVQSDSLASLHGILMLYGFLGTAITLERAVALQSDREAFTVWAYLSPAASALAVLAALLGLAQPDLFGSHLGPGLLWTLSMVTLVAIYLVIWRRQQTVFLLIQILGAVAGAVGVALWARGLEIPLVLPWWAAFIILTIVGERLELARIAFAGGTTEMRVLLESLLYFLALVATLFTPAWGYPLMGLALGLLMLDVGYHDIARRTVHTAGLTKFMAASMLAGYGWALLAAGIWVVRGPVLSGYGYDTVVHTLTIGFGLSMVMAHAPVIVPAVVRRPVPYHPIMWAIWALLQGGLLVRLLGGARATWGQPSAEVAWQFGGAVDVLTVLVFVLSTLTLIIWHGRKDRTR